MSASTGTENIRTIEYVCPYLPALAQRTQEKSSMCAHVCYIDTENISMVQCARPMFAKVDTKFISMVQCICSMSADNDTENTNMIHYAQP